MNKSRTGGITTYCPLQVQEIDLFGEISGIAFTPHADAVFVGVADLTYSSLLHYDRYQSASFEW